MGIGYRESDGLFIPSPMELRVEIPVLELVDRAAIAALPLKTKWVQIGQYPVSSLHIFTDTPVALTADVEVSNLTADNVGEVIAANVAGNKVVLIDRGAYVRVIFKTLTSGKVGVRWAAAAQAG